MTHTGNWEEVKLDLAGDDNWNETNEYNDTRTHNLVNELGARDIDSDKTDDFTLACDAAGNMTDDGENYKYTCPSAVLAGSGGVAPVSSASFE